MLAVRHAVRCLTNRLPSVASKFNVHDGPLLCWSRLSKQWPVVSNSHASFSCSSFLNTAIQKTEGQLALLQSETVEAPPRSHDSQIPGQLAATGVSYIQSEPDVLYHKIEIETRCVDPAVLQSYNIFIDTAAKCLNLSTVDDDRPLKLRKPHKKRWTVLKSRFVHRKHLVSYEVRTYHHIYCLLRVTGSTADTFLEYIQRNLPEGVSMRVGRTRMEKLPEHLLSPPSSGT